MTKIKAITINSSREKIFLWISLALIAGITPLFLHEQWITGPLVNAILVAATLTLGPWEAIAIAFIPSGMALASGLLPVVLAPTIPVIIIGNILLISGVQLFKNKPLFGILTGAVAKFIWLTIASTWILQFFIPGNFIAKVGTMLSWPQLATAILGGLIALGIIKIWKK